MPETKKYYRHPDAHKKRYARLKALGVCVHCARVDTGGRTAFCARCQAFIVASKRCRINRYRRAGYCDDCKIRRLCRRSSRRCEECRLKWNADNKRRSAAKRRQPEVA